MISRRAPIFKIGIICVERKIFKIGIICVERKIFKIGIICIERIIFKIGIICVERIIFKIGIICVERIIFKIRKKKKFAEYQSIILQALLVSLNLKMADDDSFRSRQDYPRGVPGDIRVPRDDATVATAATGASQGSAAVFQWRARCTLLEIE